jgi:hypothetical protein
MQAHVAEMISTCSPVELVELCQLVNLEVELERIAKVKKALRRGIDQAIEAWDVRGDSRELVAYRDALEQIVAKR